MYRYQPGKVDWKGAGMPWDGHDRESSLLADVAEPLPTCAPTDRADAIRAPIACAVVDANGVVLGLIRASRLAEEKGKTAVELMEPAPPSYRPDAACENAADWMTRKSAPFVLITDPDGHLLGMVTREALSRRFMRRG